MVTDSSTENSHTEKCDVGLVLYRKEEFLSCKLTLSAHQIKKKKEQF